MYFKAVIHNKKAYYTLKTRKSNIIGINDSQLWCLASEISGNTGLTDKETVKIFLVGHNRYNFIINIIMGGGYDMVFWAWTLGLFACRLDSFYFQISTFK